VTDFLAPGRLWFLLLIPVLVGVYVLLQYRKGHYAVRFTNLALLDTVVPRRVSWRQHAAVGLAMLTLAFAIVLFAKPSKEIEVPLSLNSEVTVVLILDVSLSMSATDVDPDRITAAKDTATKFIDKLPANFKVGLVSFAKVATVEIPPTKDHQAAVDAVKGLGLAEYTATGEGIYSGLQVIQQELGANSAPVSDKPPAFMVMISDGARTIGRSQVAAAEAAKAQGIAVDTVALGTPDGVIDRQGQSIPVPVEIQQLEEVAQISGGKAYVAETPNDLADAYQDVDGQLTFEKRKADATSEYVGYLVLLSLLSTGAGLFVASRWP